MPRPGSGCPKIVVELFGIQCTQNVPKAELRIDLLTRIQGSDRWKSAHLGGKKPMPRFVQDALDELDALLY